MQANLPQFIDVEDRIIGPLTLKQFLWLLAAAGIIFILWGLFEIWLVIILAIPIIALSGALAFYRPQGRSFISRLLSIFQFMSKPKEYLWKRTTAPPKIKREVKSTKGGKEDKITLEPEVTESRLKELAWTLDTQNKKEE
ncbi:MAG TPA: PrgI family protein [Candidatus Portnoybacteria bacterium]|nr:PrgI family protein [Candidatus Portnoybacteria bacterium]